MHGPLYRRSPLHFCLFGRLERVINLDAEVSNGALELRMAEEALHCAQILRAAIDQRGFRMSNDVEPSEVADLTKGLPVSRTAGSQHLWVLKDAGLVQDSSEKTRRIDWIRVASQPRGIG